MVEDERRRHEPRGLRPQDARTERYRPRPRGGEMLHLLRRESALGADYYRHGFGFAQVVERGAQR